MALQQWLGRCPLVAILRGITPDEVEAIADALVEIGFGIIEVPLNSPEALASIRRLSGRYDESVLVGAGTVLNVASVEAVAEAGGRLVVTPHAAANVARAAKAKGMFSICGFATPTEAFSLINSGADALKLFPAESSSPAELRAFRAVIPRSMPVLPVGGIDQLALASWWSAGADGFGLGSALYRRGDTAEGVRSQGQGFLVAVSALAPRT